MPYAGPSVIDAHIFNLVKAKMGSKAATVFDDATHTIRTCHCFKIFLSSCFGLYSYHDGPLTDERGPHPTALPPTFRDFHTTIYLRIVAFQALPLAPRPLPLDALGASSVVGEEVGMMMARRSPGA